MNKKSPPSSAVQLREIAAEQQGQRIDNFLIKTLKNLPRSRLYRIIRKGEVRVNGKRIRPDYKLSAGDQVRIPPLRLDTEEGSPVEIPADLIKRMEKAVIFENDAVLVVNKPAGLAVHSGSGLRYGLIDVMRVLRPQVAIELVHRLDRDTSGCLLLAKNRASLLEMQRLLQSSEMLKRYLAIVKGHWAPALKSIDLPLKRSKTQNGETRVFVDDDGQSAITLIDKVRHFSRQGIDYSSLVIHLVTGRTHQIRVHCRAQGHEIAGDQKYGDRAFNRQMKKLGSKRLLLHAVELEIPANAHTQALRLHAQQPDEFGKLVKDGQ